MALTSDGGPYDVVVVGASLAGAATAILLGRQGLRVALLETHRDPASYKRLCTHIIRPPALPTLRRLGMDIAIEQAGGVRSHTSFWTERGWVDEGPGRPQHGYSIRREKLDPLIRGLAADTDRVELFMGTKAVALSRDSADRVNGVTATRRDGSNTHFSCRLVVGADGRDSKIAQLAELPGKSSWNRRFSYFAHYRDVPMIEGHFQGWTVAPDAAAALSNDGGVVVLSVVLDHSRWSSFVDNKEAALLAMFGELEGAPDLSRAVRVSDVIGTRNYPSITRRRITRPGVALVGDSAMVADPLQGVGCGWALIGAEWLADAVGESLRTSDTNVAVDAAAQRYQRRHRLLLLPQQMAFIRASQHRSLPRLVRLILAGAANDPTVAETFWQVTSGVVSPLALTSPRLLLRAALAAKRSTT